MTLFDLRQVLAPLSDVEILALTLFGEVRGEPIEGQIAVAQVVRNRVTDGRKRWPTTYRDVCLQKSQFSCWLPVGGQANHDAVLRQAQDLIAGRRDAIMRQLNWVSAGVFDSLLMDATRSANHYHVAGMKLPTWAVGKPVTAHIGAHVFYSL